MRVLLVALLTLAVGVAEAEAQPEEALAAEAMRLAKSGDFRGAIAKFRAANEANPQPINDCRIGLAFIRLAEWDSAHFYLSRCKTLWNDGELPMWVGTRLDESTAHLESGPYTAVSLVTTPDDAHVILPAMDPRPIVHQPVWMKHGTVNIRYVVEGFAPLDYAVPVNRSVKVITRHLSARTETTTTTQPTPPPVTETSPHANPETAVAQPPISDPMAQPMPPETESTRGPPWLALGLGAGAVVAGGIGVFFRLQAQDAADDTYFLATLSRDLRQYCHDNADECDFNRQEEHGHAVDDLKRANTAMLVTWGVGGGLAVAALTSYLLHRKGSEQQPVTVGVGATPDGAQTWLQWRM